jgi:predicted nucleic acid-binding protein
VIALDTSVWVLFLRGGHAHTADEVRRLLDGDEVALPAPVRIELLSGCSPRGRNDLDRLLSALPVLYPTAETWTRLDVWVERAVNVGQRFGFGDLLIAAVAVDAGAHVWSLDHDFERMARLGWLELHRPA